MVVIRRTPASLPPAPAPALARPARAAILRGGPMALAFDAARQAAACGEVPVGAAVSDASGAILAVAANRMRGTMNACAHAEMLAMSDAARCRPSHATPGRLDGCDLWVTLEPCAMCAAAAGTFRIRRVLFGAYDPKGGGVAHGLRVFESALLSHRTEVIGGIRETESRNMLRDFFRDLRGAKSHC